MGKLILVPTPVGNLADISLRALEVLKSVELILAEDTRTSAKLLQKYNISTPCKSYHQYNEHQVCERFIQLLQSQGDIAVITDAGTPGISDPGFLLSRACIENDIEVECLPGATALIPAVVQSGFPCDRFVFEGFLPHKKGKNRKLQELALEERSIVLYESPHRLVKTLEQLCEIMGKERKVCVCREISKIHHENRRGSLEEVLQHYQDNPPKGEIVIVLEGCSHDTYTYKYPRPAVTVDGLVVAQLKDHSRYLLLVQRKNPPFEGFHAFPGGFVEEDETLEYGVYREVKEETGLSVKKFQADYHFFRPYSQVDRDPRGRTITMTYYCILNVDELPEIAGDDDACSARWFPIDQLPELAFDHGKIWQDFLSARILPY